LKNNFVVPGLINIPLNFIIIFFIAISYQFDIIFLAFGTTIALVFQMLVLIPFVNKKGYKYSLTFNMYDKDLKKFVYLSIPVIIGVSVNQINVLVDRTLASQIAIGGISALTYANRLNYFVQGIFVASISTSAYPMISKLAVENNISRLKKSLSEAICGINLLIIPVTIGTMIFAKPVIKLLFGRGAFDSQAIYMTSYALFFYSIGMVGVGLREIVAKVFYSFQDTKTPMINASISLGVNVVLNIILSKFLGIGGLALASSISAIFCTVLLFISLRKKIGPFGMKNITISFIKILCASLAMGVISKVSYNALFKNINANLSLILSIGIGAITYFTIIYFMRIEEVDVIVNAIKRKMIKTVS
jgi:putative peptidoglycan lipid II flippase